MDTQIKLTLEEYNLLISTLKKGIDGEKLDTDNLCIIMNAVGKINAFFLE